MKRKQVINSNSLKERFCKDNNLPIAVYDNPYFYERLCTLDTLFNCVDEFDDFCEELLKYSCEQEYFEYCDSIINTVATHIKSKDDYIKFGEECFPINTDEFKKQDLYASFNNNRTFISIDMRNTDFPTMRLYSPAIFDDATSWREFMQQFTTDKHIANSKYIKKMILEDCNPVGQVWYEKSVMLGLAQLLTNAIKTLRVFSLDKNEIILYTEDCGLSIQQLTEIFSNTPIEDIVRIRMFDLEMIKGTNGWLKTIYDFENNEEIIEFENLDSEIFHQVVKYYYKEAITDNDLVFYHNGRLAKLLKEIGNPWEY